MQAVVGQNDPQSNSLPEGDNGSKLRSILRRLNMVSDDIEASAVTSSDGLIKAAMLGDEIDPDRFGAMCATLLALSKRAAKETARGELKLLLIEGTQGTMLIVQIGDKGVLALAARPKSNLGMIFLEARRVAGEISGLL